MVTDPGTRSPGKLILWYLAFGNEHRVSVNYIAGTDIEDITACRADATDFANALKVCMESNRSITAWGIQPAGDPVGYREAFTTPIAGTHAASGAGYNSWELTLSGNGVSLGVGSATGKTHVSWFPGAVLSNSGGTKQFAVSGDAGLTALSAWLHTNLRCFADYYGQHAEPKSYATCQFNAHVQKKLGS